MGRGENGQGGNVWGKEVKRSGLREAHEMANSIDWESVLPAE